MRARWWATARGPMIWSRTRSRGRCASSICGVPAATSVDILDLQRALGSLAPEQREVVLLVALEDMSYADVSRTLGIPMGTVMSRLSRGRERLRKVMDGASRSGLRVVQ